MSKNLSDIFPPTEIGGGGGGIEEAPKTGKLYARSAVDPSDGGNADGMGWKEFDAGNLEPGSQDGEVLVWDNSQSPPEWMPNDTLIVKGGNVGIGTNSPTSWSHLDVHGSTSSVIKLTNPVGYGTVQLEDDGQLALYRGADGSGSNRNIHIKAAAREGNIKFSTGGLGAQHERLTIDSSGNATFKAPDRTIVTLDGAGNPLGSLLKLENDKGNWNLSSFPSSMGTVFDIYNEAKNDSALSFDQDSTATFSGTVGMTRLNSTYWMRASKGLALSGDALIAITTDAGSNLVNNPSAFNLGTSTNRFNQVFATVVRMSSGTAIGTRDLIETLSTLRNATKDETTLEGLRDAIGNAVGGLIEKFEAMEAVTQEISDE